MAASAAEVGVVPDIGVAAKQPKQILEDPLRRVRHDEMLNGGRTDAAQLGLYAMDGAPWVPRFRVQRTVPPSQSSRKDPAADPVADWDCFGGALELCGAHKNLQKRSGIL